MLSRRTLLTFAPLSGLALGHSASTANTATYIDLPDGALFHTEITWALSKGLIAGYPDKSIPHSDEKWDR